MSTSAVNAVAAANAANNKGYAAQFVNEQMKKTSNGATLLNKLGITTITGALGLSGGRRRSSKRRSAHKKRTNRNKKRTNRNKKRTNRNKKRTNRNQKRTNRNKKRTNRK
jgi:hypothetical protein